MGDNEAQLPSFCFASSTRSQAAALLEKATGDVLRQPEEGGWDFPLRFKVWTSGIQRIHRDFIGIMEKKMETTIIYRGI